MHSTMFKLRGFYLATGLSGGMLIPYLSLLLKHNGFQSGTVGMVMSIGTAFAILTQPIWGFIVDKFQFTRMTLAMSAFIPGVLAVLFDIPWLWMAVLTNVLWNMFASPQAPIADSYAVVTAARTGASYGSVRMFSSLGFAIGSLISGEYIAHLPITSLFIPYTVIAVLGGAIAFLFPKDDVPFAGSVSIREGVVSLFHNRQFVLFLVGGFLVSQTLTAFNTYFALTFQAMGGSLALTGVAFLLASGTNVPAMLIARAVTNKLGREQTLLLSAVAYVLRWLLQALVPIPWFSIVIQVLHGVSFGFYYIAAVDFVSKSANREMQATAQSIFGVICSGLAGIVGNLLNGFLLHYGATVMYLSCTVSSVLGSACFALVWRMKAPTTDKPTMVS